MPAGRGIFPPGKRVFAGIRCAFHKNAARHGGNRPAQTAFEAVDTGSYSLTAPMVMPDVKYRWKQMKMISMGILATAAPAIL